MDLGIKGQYALVSGSNRGTGLFIAKSLLAEQARVFVHALDQSAAAQACEELANENAIPVSGDICTDAGAEKLFEQVTSHTDTLQILVNNFGQAGGGKWESSSSKDWIQQYEINVLSAMRLIQAFMPGMKSQAYGRIIQLSTIGSVQPNARMPHYYAAKGAIANMTVSLAKELEGFNITVNTVSPGLIKTPELEAWYRARAKKKNWGDDWQDIEKAITRHEFPNPIGRIAEREEVADLVCFLASTKAGFINAQNIRVDGGAVALVV